MVTSEKKKKKKLLCGTPQSFCALGNCLCRLCHGPALPCSTLEPIFHTLVGSSVLQVVIKYSFNTEKAC